jgi:hypothetical protein
LADIIVLNAHAQTEDESDDTEHSFCGELERVFDKFPKYRRENSVTRFQCKCREERYVHTDKSEREFTPSVKIVKFYRVNTIGEIVLSNVWHTIPYEVLWMY